MLVKQNILRLYVSMYNVARMKVRKATYELAKESSRNRLIEGS